METPEFITKEDLLKALDVLKNNELIWKESYISLKKFLEETTIVCSNNNDFYRVDDHTIAMPVKTEFTWHHAIANIILNCYIGKGYPTEPNEIYGLVWYNCFLWASQAIRILTKKPSSKTITLGEVSFDSKFLMDDEIYYIVELFRKELDVNQVAFSNMIFHGIVQFYIEWATIRGCSRYTKNNIRFIELMNRTFSILSEGCTEKLSYEPDYNYLYKLIQEIEAINVKLFSPGKGVSFTTRAGERQVDHSNKFDVYRYI